MLLGFCGPSLRFWILRGRIRGVWEYESATSSRTKQHMLKESFGPAFVFKVMKPLILPLTKKSYFTSHDIRWHFLWKYTDYFSKYLENVCISSGCLRPSRQAHLSGRKYLEYQIAQGFTSVDGSSRLYVGRESLYPGASGWPIPHDAPYKAQLDHWMMAAVEASVDRD